MKTAKQNPQWWQLYLTFPLLIGLFIADSRINLPMLGHQIVQIGIVVFVYWLIHTWLKANERALSKMDRLENSPTFRVVRLPVYSLPFEDQQPRIQLPESEIKGLLSDTFEIDMIDVKASPVEEVSTK